MSVLDQKIKQMAYKVATAHLNEGADLNDSIADLYSDGEIKNNEILKRVCEAANNVVYMTLFKNKQTDRSQIKFPLADSMSLMKKIDQESGVMVEDKTIDYLTAPDKVSVIKVASSRESFEKIASANSDNKNSEKIAYAIQKLAQIEDNARKMVYNLEMIKTSAEKRSETLLNDFIGHGVDTISANESFADMTKIAMRSVAPDFGESGVKVIQAISTHAMDKIASRGFKVNTELTKVSSLNINGDNELSKTARSIVLELEEAAACKKMIDGINNSRNTIKKVRNEISKKQA